MDQEIRYDDVLVAKGRMWNDTVTSEEKKIN